MPNTLLTPTMITRETLRILENNLVFAKNVNRDFQDEFQKIGTTLTVRKPVRFTVTQGSVALSAQDVTELSVVLTLTNQDHVDFSFTTAELTHTIDQFSDRYLKPAGAELANAVDVVGANLYKDVYNLVGTDGTTPNAYSFLALVGQRLSEEACPDDSQRGLVVNPATRWALANAFSSGFNPQAQISGIFQKGRLGNIASFEVAEDQNIVTHTYGQRGGSPTLNGQPANGATSLVTTAWTAGAANRLKQGDVFTLASVFAVNPKNRASTGVLRQIVATADFASDGSGNGTISISPALYFSGPYQNISVQPGASAALTMFGTASAQRGMNIGYHRDAFTLAVRPLEIPEGVHFAGRQNYQGLSVRIVRAYDIATDKIPCRMDILYGWRTVYPELACRLTT